MSHRRGGPAELGIRFALWTNRVLWITSLPRQPARAHHDPHRTASDVAPQASAPNSVTTCSRRRNPVRNWPATGSARSARLQCCTASAVPPQPWPAPPRSRRCWRTPWSTSESSRAARACRPRVQHRFRHQRGAEQRGGGADAATAAQGVEAVDDDEALAAAATSTAAGRLVPQVARAFAAARPRGAAIPGPIAADGSRPPGPRRRIPRAACAARLPRAGQLPRNMHARERRRPRWRPVPRRRPRTSPGDAADVVTPARHRGSRRHPPGNPGRRRGRGAGPPNPVPLADSGRIEAEESVTTTTATATRLRSHRVGRNRTSAESERLPPRERRPHRRGHRDVPGPAPVDAVGVAPIGEDVVAHRLREVDAAARFSAHHAVSAATAPGAPGVHPP